MRKIKIGLVACVCLLFFAIATAYGLAYGSKDTGGRIEGPIVEGTCSNSSVDCHWQVHYCEEWYDAPTDCMKLGPADPDVEYGTASWSNYYCSCDMKCHPKGECPNGQTSELIAKQCSAKYGWPNCPEDAFTCYWAATNSNNVKCPMPKCCGGWCDLWDPC